MASPKQYSMVATWVLALWFLIIVLSTTTHAFLWRTSSPPRRIPSATTSMVRNPFPATFIQTKSSSSKETPPVPPSPSQKTPVSAFQSFWEDFFVSSTSTTKKQPQDETPKAALEKESKIMTFSNPFQDMMMNWSKVVVTSNSPQPQVVVVVVPPEAALPPTEPPAGNFWDSWLISSSSTSSSASSTTTTTTSTPAESTMPSSSSSLSLSTKEDAKFDFVQRIESIKCAIVGALAGSLAMAPYAFLHYLGNVAQWEFQTDLAALQGALFAIVYRYAIRGDTNPMLNQGVLGAFVLVRTLPSIQASSSQCTAIPLNCGPPTGYLNWDMIGQGFSQGIESALLFGGACAAMDYAFEKGWISKFE